MAAVILTESHAVAAPCLSTARSEARRRSVKRILAWCASHRWRPPSSLTEPATRALHVVLSGLLRPALRLEKPANLLPRLPSRGRDQNHSRQLERAIPCSDGETLTVNGASVPVITSVTEGFAETTVYDASDPSAWKRLATVPNYIYGIHDPPRGGKTTRTESTDPPELAPRPLRPCRGRRAPGREEIWTADQLQLISLAVSAPRRRARFRCRGSRAR
jgi:hypothetical protein